MDFLDPNKKRAHRIKLFTGYFLVAIAIGMGALILLLMTSGYGIDSGRVIKKGLVFFNSRPGGSQVYVEGVHNDIKQQGQTDTRMELREGQYRVSIQRQGYRDWNREFNIEGGAVERMVYPFLFPVELSTVEQRAWTAEPKLVSSSPDRQWIVAQQPDSFLSFDVINANDPERAVDSFTLPADLFSPASQSQQLEAIEWSNDNVNLLVKHVFDDQQEFVVINRDKPAESFNVNRITGQQPHAVSLKDKKVQELYLHMSVGGLLQVVNIESGALSPQVGNALAFKSHGGDMLVYVAASTKAADKAIVRLHTNDKEYDLRELPLSPDYVVDVARFNNRWYVAVGAGGDDKVYVYRDPLDVLAARSPRQAIFARTLRIKNPQNISFSANTRVVAVQSGNNFAVYDAETDRQYRYEIADLDSSSRPAKWMDGHRLTTVVDGQALVFDFDGANQQRLMAASPLVDIMFDRDYDYAYALSNNSDTGQTVLTRTDLEI